MGETSKWMDYINKFLDEYWLLSGASALCYLAFLLNLERFLKCIGISDETLDNKKSVAAIILLYIGIFAWFDKNIIYVAYFSFFILLAYPISFIAYSKKALQLKNKNHIFFKKNTFKGVLNKQRQTEDDNDNSTWEFKAVSVITGIVTTLACLAAKKGFCSIIWGVIAFGACIAIANFICDFCALPLKVFDRSSNVYDGNLAFLLFLISLLVDIYMYAIFPNTNEKHCRVFSVFLLINMALLLIIFLYRVVINMVHVEPGKDNQKYKTWTVLFVMLLILMVFFAILIYIDTLCGGIKSNCHCILSPIGPMNVIYYTVMTFTTVGYGDFVPKSGTMRVFSCIISIFSLMSSVLFIESICNIFHDKEKPLKGWKRFLIVMVTIFGSVLIVFALIWVFSYIDPKSFNVNFNDIGTLFYYTITTLSSVGYGDITPKTEPAKILICFISLYGYLFNGVFLGFICHMFRLKK